MQFINALDLLEATDALLAKAARLPKSAAVALYLPMLQQRRDALAALIRKDPTKLPAAYRDELAEADAQHDAYGRALDALCAFYERLPSATAAQKKAVAAVRASFLPSLEELLASYETQANAARQRRPLLAKHRAALKALSYSAKGTAYGLAQKMLAHGDALAALLQKRAEETAKQRPTDTRALPQTRATLLAALSGLRAALAAEVGRNGVTDAVLAELFARLDETSARREGAASRKRATAKKRAAKGAAPKPAPKP